MGIGVVPACHSNNHVTSVVFSNAEPNTPNANLYACGSKCDNMLTGVTDEHVSTT